MSEEEEYPPLIEIKLRLPLPILDQIDWLVKQGNAVNRSEWIRRAISTYLEDHEYLLYGYVRKSK